MAEFKVVEIFESINGEGQRAGQLAVFVRLAGCNLNCSYCDTKWANKADVSYVVMTEKEIYSRVRKTNIKNVTITGGEPLFRSGAKELLELSEKYVSPHDLTPKTFTKKDGASLLAYRYLSDTSSTTQATSWNPAIS